jgi:hypothetical protein
MLIMDTIHNSITWSIRKVRMWVYIRIRYDSKRHMTRFDCCLETVIRGEGCEGESIFVFRWDVFCWRFRGNTRWLIRFSLNGHHICTSYEGIRLVVRTTLLFHLLSKNSRSIQCVRELSLFVGFSMALLSSLGWTLFMRVHVADYSEI